MNKFKPEVRVFFYLRNSKELIQVHSVINVSVSLGFNGVGSASITLRSKDLRFLMPEKRIELENFDSREITVWEQFLDAHDDPWLKHIRENMFKDIGSYNVFEPIFSPLGLVWIDARGRDGRWYALFSGVVIQPSDTEAAGQGTTITLQCNTYRYFLDYFPIVKGLHNFGEDQTIETILTEFQSGSLSQEGVPENIFQGKDAVKIFREIITTVNQIITLNEGNSIYENRRIWIPFSHQSNDLERDLGLDEPLIFRKSTPQRTDYLPEASDNATDPYAYFAVAYIQPRFQLEIFKRLIRNRFELYVIDKEHASTLIQYITDSVFSDWYIDPLGNLRVEAPNFNSCPVVENDYSLKFHNANYIITRKDVSCISTSFEFNANDVVTYVTVPFTWLKPAQEPNLYKPEYTRGVSKASDIDMQVFGLREFTTQPIYTNLLPSSLPKDIKNAIAEALRIKISQKAGKTVYTLNQRPDLQLNKTILNADRGQVHLITSISHNINVGYSHTTTVVCEYNRYVGEILPDPWKTLEGFSSSLNAEEQLKHFNSATVTNQKR